MPAVMVALTCVVDQLHCMRPAKGTHQVNLWLARTCQKASASKLPAIIVDAPASTGASRLRKMPPAWNWGIMLSPLSCGVMPQEDTMQPTPVSIVSRR